MIILKLLKILKFLRKFANQTSKLLVVNGDDVNAREVVKESTAEKYFMVF